jgi:mitochondrial fission protein ELM1
METTQEMKSSKRERKHFTSDEDEQIIKYVQHFGSPDFFRIFDSLSHRTPRQVRENEDFFQSRY